MKTRAGENGLSRTPASRVADEILGHEQVPVELATEPLERLVRLTSGPITVKSSRSPAPM